MAELFFGDFRFDTRALRLEGSEGVVEVRAKALELLTYLIEHRNRFVPRSELMEHLWPDVTVTDASLTQCVSELRQVLGDSSRNPLYIETRIKNGYRFAAVVYYQPTDRLEPLPPPTAVEQKAPRSGEGRLLLGLLGSLIVAIVAITGWWIAGARASESVAIEIVQVASGGDDAAMLTKTCDCVSERLSAIHDLEVIRPGSSTGAPVAFELELACTPIAAGRELCATLRSKRDGDIRWGWSWIVPAERGAEVELPEAIAERVARSVAAELGFTGAPARSIDPHRQAEPSGPDRG